MNPATSNYIRRKHKTFLLCNFQLDQETYLHDGQLLLRTKMFKLYNEISIYEYF